MSGEDIFQKINRLEAEVASLKALVGPLLRGGLSTEAIVGVLPAHTHGGTGGGGGTLAPTALNIMGDLNHDGTKIGFFGVAPAVRAAAYTTANVTPDRDFDADATSLDELADVVGTLIADWKLYGLLQ